MPQVLEEIVALVACRRQATARVDVHCACRLQAPGDSTGGRALRLSLTGARRQHGWTCTCREADRGWSGTTDPGEDC